MTLGAALLWYVFIGLVLWAFQRTTRCLTCLNIFTLFLAFLALRHGITVPFDENVNAAFTNYPVSSIALRRFYIALVVMYLAVLAGALVTRYLLRTPVECDFETGSASRVEYLPVGLNRPLFWLMAIAACVILLAVWIRLPLDLVQWARQGLSAEVYRAWRDAYGQLTLYSASALNYLGAVLRFGLLPALIFVFFCLRHRGLAYRLFFWLTLGLGLGIGLLSGQKSPALYLLLGLGVTAWLASGQSSIRVWDWRILGTGLVLLLGVLPLLYEFQYPGEFSYLRRLGLTAFRLTSEADRSLQLYFHFYPDVYPHLWGANSFVLNKVLMLGYEGLPPERLIPVTVLGPEYLNTWNGAFIAYAWADFGWAGVVAQSLFVGGLLQTIHHWYVTSRKSAALVGVYGALIMAGTKLSEVSLLSTLLSFGLGLTIMTFLLLKTPVDEDSVEAVSGPAPAGAYGVKRISPA